MTYTYANSMLVDVLDKEAIPFQRKISGYIAMNEDVDYYKLEVPARGIVNLSMDLKQAELLVAIHDEQDNEVYKGISVKMGTSNKYCTLDKGTYYLRFYSKIFLDSNYLSVGQYYFTASYKLASLEAAVVTKKSGTSFNVTAVNPGDISGYNIRYRKGNGLWKMVNVAGNDDLNKTISVAPNTYTVQVQTYCTVGDKTYYSDWSKEQKVTCKISTPSSVKVKNSSKNALKITAKKKGTIAGYQVRYRKGSGSWKNVTVKGNKNLSKTIKKLKKGSTYYVQVRAYCKLSGKNYYSNWSSKKKIKIKK